MIIFRVILSLAIHTANIEYTVKTGKGFLNLGKNSNFQVNILKRTTSRNEGDPTD